jgi:signal transduction histidine kinase
MKFGAPQCDLSKKYPTWGRPPAAAFRLRNHGSTGFAAGGLVIFLSLIGMLMFQQTDTAQQIHSLIRHNQEVVGDISRLNILIRDAETGQRGYVLTGRLGYLQPYNKARELLPPLTENLRHLVTDDSRQQAQLVAVSSLIQQKLAELEETVQLRTNFGEEEAKRVVLSDLGWKVMNQITSALDAMAVEENRELAERNLLIERSEATMRLLTAGGSAAAILSVALAGLMLRRGTIQRREIEQENEQQRNELARSNADLEDFAYAASHDLKAPLRAISHLVQWIADDIEPTAVPETLENLRLLQARMARMQMLLDGLLAYSRVGHNNLTVENVEIADVVRDIVAMLAPAPGFVVAFEGTVTVIRTHRVPIQIVLENLISNGLKHHDRAEGRIAVHLQPVEGAMEFRVTDDGPGIATQFHDRIFLMFQTLASRDDVESSGIGLTIVKKKVQTHGGRIWVESAPPARGTTFGFTWKESES